MKADEVLKRYAAGERNFRKEDLRGIFLEIDNLADKARVCFWEEYNRAIATLLNIKKKMTSILVSNKHPETENLLIKCLETAGFEIIDTENGLFSVKLADEKRSSISESEQLNTQESIFPSIPRLNEVFEFIELNYHQNIKLKEVAKAVGYSSAYLTDLVRKLTGKTVNNWIIERRIAEASILLLETNFSVEQIAVNVGYQNINHFYGQFRDRYQNTPSAWREEQRSQVA